MHPSMSASLPLLVLDHEASFDTPFAWRHGVAISRARFLNDVATLADALPDRGYVLNVCADRYRFAVGLAAAIVRNQVSLMPPSTHAETVRQLTAQFPDAYCLAEAPQPDIDLQQLLYDDAFASRTNGVREVPRVPVDQSIAYVFTSGSTGAPTPHRKRWGSLVENVRSEATRLGIDGAMSPFAIVATVPPQHMFGFESSVLLAWQSGAAMVAERPFFPADIVAALERVPGRRMLVTTPFHLRTLLSENGALAAVELVLCATAPLSLELAAEAERRFDAPVSEIYGCTETGQIASRRPTVDPRWHLLGNVTLAMADDRTVASGGHVEQPTPLADVIALASDFEISRRFTLVGRSADMVNIAGKRTSLGHLNAQLLALDGVIDGAFLMPDEDDSRHDGVTRLAAVVVAPTLDTRRVLAGLRSRIDAVFLPRPIHFVDELPRNAAGKLTRDTLDALVSRHERQKGGSAIATDVVVAKALDEGTHR